MSTVNTTKINQLLSSTANNVVLTSSWLEQNGYSFELQKKYRKSVWLKSIGTGAMIRNGETATLEGALYALQFQLGTSIHIGAKSALSLLGKAHYLELSKTKTTLFGCPKEQLPAWFKNHDWGVTIDYHQTNFLPVNLGMIDFEHKNFTIKISSAPRAMIECFYLATSEQDLFECYELMEGLNNLRPSQVQQLLEACGSIKVKRLFLYMAEKANHEWLKHLDISRINLGTGKRSIIKNGLYVPKYQIVVSKELEANERSSL